MNKSYICGLDCVDVLAIFSNLCKKKLCLGILDNSCTVIVVGKG